MMDAREVFTRSRRVDRPAQESYPTRRGLAQPQKREVAGGSRRQKISAFRRGHARNRGRCAVATGSLEEPVKLDARSQSLISNAMFRGQEILRRSLLRTGQQRAAARVSISAGNIGN